MCFDQCPSQWSYFRVKELFIYFLVPILGHPVHQFLQKLDFSDSTVSGSGLPVGHRYWKYVSLCWSNSIFMANARVIRVILSPIGSIGYKAKYDMYYKDMTS